MEKNLNLGKAAKLVFFLIKFITLGSLAVIIYWNYTHTPGRQKMILDEAKTLSFHGRIKSIYFDKTNHSAETLVLSDGYRYWLYPDWSTLVTVGDSLSKDLGTFQVEVYKKNMTVDTLDYKKLIKTIR